MTPERWETIKQTVRKQYPSLEEGSEDLVAETAEGLVKQGEAEFLIFDAPESFGEGRIKLQFQKRPKVEGKKYFYSHRAGTSARVEYKYSESDMVYAFKAYKWDDVEDDWKEIDSSSFGR